MRLMVLIVLLCCFSEGIAQAAESACARVSLEIAQELTLERVAFDAKLVIHNKIPDKDLTNIRVDVSIVDESGNQKNQQFFIRLTSQNNISETGGDDNAVNGDGIVNANTSAEVHWLIIPSPGAGGQATVGVPYDVGATLTYTMDGESQVLPINPDRITVKPAPLLYLDYFTPYQVLGDNPFTPETEAPIPYPLAVRVMNDGYGPANTLKIDSAQPRIVENSQGLLIDFRLLGASVNDQPVQSTLLVDMGDLASKTAGTAHWEMISSLSGRVVEFSAEFSHADELGGELTSLLQETDTHYLIHRVKANLPGRDDRLDFLADAGADGGTNPFPDTLFESQIPAGGSDRSAAQSSVSTQAPLAAPQRPTPEEPQVGLTLNLGAIPPSGWIYTRMADPSQGLLVLEDVIRADGVHLDPNNFWVDEGLDADYQAIHTLQFFDYRNPLSPPPAGYTLVFAQPGDDLEPPVSTLVFDGPVLEGETTAVTPQTRIVFTAADNEGGSGIEAMFKKLTGSEVVEDSAFVGAQPFNLAAGAEATLEYYALDRAGNVEATQSRSIVVDDAPPVIDSLAVVPDSFAPQTPAGMAGRREVELVLTASDTLALELPVTVDILLGETVVKSFSATATSGSELRLSWNGQDNNGHLLAEGSYLVRATVGDGLDNSLDEEAPSHHAGAEETVTIVGWFEGIAIDPTSTDQQYPVMAGSQVVWQDMRNGTWDIYRMDIASLPGTSQQLTTNDADQQHPATDGARTVWQDARNGGWDIYGFSTVEEEIYSGGGDQQLPVVAGDWVAWQDNRNGNWDIYAKDLATVTVYQLTSHERDQLHPALDGSQLYWEDYRHGLADIYRIDLAALKAGGQVVDLESRVTFDLDSQIDPVGQANLLLWTDRRDGQQEIYRDAGYGQAQRLTYGEGDRNQPTLLDGVLIYVDGSAGSDDPNLAFVDLNNGSGAILSSHPARQEQPALGGGMVAWRDDRDGVWQIYAASLQPNPQPVQVALLPGYNLLAVGQNLVDRYPTASDLLADQALPGLERALFYSAPHGQYFEADLAGRNFDLDVGMGLDLYAGQAGSLQVAASGEKSSYTLLVGTNHIGMLTGPYGYRAYDLLRSIGLENIQGVRRFDGQTGLWQSAAVRGPAESLELVGQNFTIHAGDGLVITMKQRVDGWQP
jgi:beta propeller repeat protein